MRPLCGLLLALSGCAAPLSSDFDGPPYLTLGGPVELDGPVGEAPVTAAVAWAWTEAGTLHTVVVDVPFEPEVYFYRLTVPGPPTVAPTAEGPAPSALADQAVLVGLPLLLQSEELPLAAPGGFVRWLGGEQVPPSDWLSLPSGRVLAWAEDHLLIAMATGGPERLGDAPGVDLSALCGVADVVPGLTLYQRSATASCPAAWESLAPPGNRTDFQGVVMRSP